MMILRIDHLGQPRLSSMNSGCECSRTSADAQRYCRQRTGSHKYTGKVLVSLLAVCLAVAAALILAFAAVPLSGAARSLPTVFVLPPWTFSRPLLYAAASNETSAPPATAIIADNNATANYSISLNNTLEHDYDGISLTPSVHITPAGQGTRSGTFSLVEKTPTTYTRDIPKTASNPLTLTSELTISVRRTFTPTTYTHALTATPTPELSSTATVSRSVAPSYSSTLEASRSHTDTWTKDPTDSHTVVMTRSFTESKTILPTFSRTAEGSRTETASTSLESSPSHTFSVTASESATITKSASESISPSASASNPSPTATSTIGRCERAICRMLSLNGKAFTPHSPSAEEAARVSGGAYYVNEQEAWEVFDDAILTHYHYCHRALDFEEWSTDGTAFGMSTLKRIVMDVVLPCGMGSFMSGSVDAPSFKIAARFPPMYSQSPWTDPVAPPTRAPVTTAAPTTTRAPTTTPAQTAAPSTTTLMTTLAPTSVLTSAVPSSATVPATTASPSEVPPPQPTTGTAVTSTNTTANDTSAVPFATTNAPSANETTATATSTSQNSTAASDSSTSTTALGTSTAATVITNTTAATAANTTTTTALATVAAGSARLMHVAAATNSSSTTTAAVSTSDASNVTDASLASTMAPSAPMTTPSIGTSAADSNGTTSSVANHTVTDGNATSETWLPTTPYHSPSPSNTTTTIAGNSTSDAAAGTVTATDAGNFTTAVTTSGNTTWSPNGTAPTTMPANVTATTATTALPVPTNANANATTTRPTTTSATTPRPTTATPRPTTTTTPAPTTTTPPPLPTRDPYDVAMEEYLAASLGRNPYTHCGSATASMLWVESALRYGRRVKALNNTFPDEEVLAADNVPAQLSDLGYAEIEGIRYATPMGNEGASEEQPANAETTAPEVPTNHTNATTTTAAATEFSTSSPSSPSSNPLASQAISSSFRLYHLPPFATYPYLINITVHYKCGYNEKSHIFVILIELRAPINKMPLLEGSVASPLAAVLMRGALETRAKVPWEPYFEQPTTVTPLPPPPTTAPPAGNATANNNTNTSAAADGGVTEASRLTATAPLHVSGGGGASSRRSLMQSISDSTTTTTTTTPAVASLTSAPAADGSTSDVPNNITTVITTHVTSSDAGAAGNVTTPFSANGTTLVPVTMPAGGNESTTASATATAFPANQTATATATADDGNTTSTDANVTWAPTTTAPTTPTPTTTPFPSIPKSNSTSIIDFLLGPSYTLEEIANLLINHMALMEAAAGFAAWVGSALLAVLPLSYAQLGMLFANLRMSQCAVTYPSRPTSSYGPSSMETCLQYFADGLQGQHGAGGRSTPLAKAVAESSGVADDGGQNVLWYWGEGIAKPSTALEDGASMASTTSAEDSSSSSSSLLSPLLDFLPEASWYVNLPPLTVGYYPKVAIFNLQSAFPWLLHPMRFPIGMASETSAMKDATDAVEALLSAATTARDTITALGYHPSDADSNENASAAFVRRNINLLEDELGRIVNDRFEHLFLRATIVWNAMIVPFLFAVAVRFVLAPLLYWLLSMEVEARDLWLTWQRRRIARATRHRHHRRQHHHRQTRNPDGIVSSPIKHGRRGSALQLSASGVTNSDVLLIGGGRARSVDLSAAPVSVKEGGSSSYSAAGGKAGSAVDEAPPMSTRRAMANRLVYEPSVEEQTYLQQPIPQYADAVALLRWPWIFLAPFIATSHATAVAVVRLLVTLSNAGKLVASESRSSAERDWWAIIKGLWGNGVGDAASSSEAADASATTATTDPAAATSTTSSASASSLPFPNINPAFADCIGLLNLPSLEGFQLALVSIMLYGDVYALPTRAAPLGANTATIAMVERAMDLLPKSTVGTLYQLISTSDATLAHNKSSRSWAADRALAFMGAVLLLAAFLVLVVALVSYIPQTVSRFANGATDIRRHLMGLSIGGGAAGATTDYAVIGVLGQSRLPSDILPYSRREIWNAIRRIVAVVEGRVGDVDKRRGAAAKQHSSSLGTAAGDVMVGSLGDDTFAAFPSEAAFSSGGGGGGGSDTFFSSPSSPSFAHHRHSRQQKSCRRRVRQPTHQAPRLMYHLEHCNLLALIVDDFRDEGVLESNGTSRKKEDVTDSNDALRLRRRREKEARIKARQKRLQERRMRTTKGARKTKNKKGKKDRDGFSSSGSSEDSSDDDALDESAAGHSGTAGSDADATSSSAALLLTGPAQHKREKDEEPATIATRPSVHRLLKFATVPWASRHPDLDSLVAEVLALREQDLKYALRRESEDLVRHNKWERITRMWRMKRRGDRYGTGDTDSDEREREMDAYDGGRGKSPKTLVTSEGKAGAGADPASSAAAAAADAIIKLSEEELASIHREVVTKAWGVYSTIGRSEGLYQGHRWPWSLLVIYSCSIVMAIVENMNATTTDACGIKVLIGAIIYLLLTLLACTTVAVPMHCLSAVIVGLAGVVAAVCGLVYGSPNIAGVDFAAEYGLYGDPFLFCLMLLLVFCAAGFCGATTAIGAVLLVYEYFIRFTQARLMIALLTTTSSGGRGAGGRRRDSSSPSRRASRSGSLLVGGSAGDDTSEGNAFPPGQTYGNGGAPTVSDDDDAEGERDRTHSDQRRKGSGGGFGSWFSRTILRRRPASADAEDDQDDEGQHHTAGRSRLAVPMLEDTTEGGDYDGGDGRSSRRVRRGGGGGSGYLVDFDRLDLVRWDDVEMRSKSSKANPTNTAAAGGGGGVGAECPKRSALLREAKRKGLDYTAYTHTYDAVAPSNNKSALANLFSSSSSHARHQRDTSPTPTNTTMPAMVMDDDLDLLEDIELDDYNANVRLLRVDDDRAEQHFSLPMHALGEFPIVDAAAMSAARRAAGNNKGRAIRERRRQDPNYIVSVADLDGDVDDGDGSPGVDADGLVEDEDVLLFGHDAARRRAVAFCTPVRPKGPSRSHVTARMRIAAAKHKDRHDQNILRKARCDRRKALLEQKQAARIRRRGYTKTLASEVGKDSDSDISVSSISSLLSESSADLSFISHGSYTSSSYTSSSGVDDDAEFTAAYASVLRGRGATAGAPPLSSGGATITSASKDVGFAQPSAPYWANTTTAAFTAASATTAAPAAGKGVPISKYHRHQQYGGLPTAEEDPDFYLELPTDDSDVDPLDFMLNPPSRADRRARRRDNVAARRAERQAERERAFHERRSVLYGGGGNSTTNKESAAATDAAATARTSMAAPPPPTVEALAIGDDVDGEQIYLPVADDDAPLALEVVPSRSVMAHPASPAARCGGGGGADGGDVTISLLSPIPSRRHAEGGVGGGDDESRMQPSDASAAIRGVASTVPAGEGNGDAATHTTATNSRAPPPVKGVLHPPAAALAKRRHVLPPPASSAAPSSSISPAERKKELATSIKAWKAAFMAANGRKARKPDLAGDAAMMATYMEWKSLGGGGDDEEGGGGDGGEEGSTKPTQVPTPPPPPPPDHFKGLPPSHRGIEPRVRAIKLRISQRKNFIISADPRLGNMSLRELIASNEELGALHGEMRRLQALLEEGIVAEESAAPPPRRPKRPPTAAGGGGGPAAAGRKGRPPPPAAVSAEAPAPHSSSAADGAQCEEAAGSAPPPKRRPPQPPPAGAAAAVPSAPAPAAPPKRVVGKKRPPPLVRIASEGGGALVSQPTAVVDPVVTIDLTDI